MSAADTVKLNAEQRRALELLVEAGLRGSTVDFLVRVHGFTVVALTGLVRGGYASVAPEKMRIDGRPVDVVRVVITDAGRQAIAH